MVAGELIQQPSTLLLLRRNITPSKGEVNARDPGKRPPADLIGPHCSKCRLP